MTGAVVVIVDLCLCLGNYRCCSEINVISDLLEKDGVQCITDHQGFKPVYLNPYVLETAYNQYNHEIPNLKI